MGKPFQQMYADQYAHLADACRSVCTFSRCLQISMPFQQMHVDQYAYSADVCRSVCPFSRRISVCPFSRRMEISMPSLHPSPCSLYTKMCPMLQSALQSAEEYAREMQQMEWPMHPPGQILHIVEQEEST